jgi:hypothetical protein
VAAATTTENEWPLGESGCEREGLLGEGLLVDDSDLGVWKREKGGLGHRLAAATPSSRNPHEPRRE